MKDKMIRRLTITAVLTAISILLILFNFPILPMVSFLRFDFANIPILIVTFAFGPVYGVISTIITAIFQATFLSADGWFGGLMHIFSTGSLIITAGLIYKHKKTRKMAALALACGSAAMVIAMVAFNLIFDPFLYHLETEVVVSLLPYIALFNLIKAGCNAIITFIIYKYISRFIKAKE